MIPNKRSEKGQALIMIVIGFVVILGFVGLGIDAGMVYSDRRNAQNAADASSLAGGAAGALDLENSYVFLATWDCNDIRILTAMADAQTAAINRATGNNFSIGTDTTTNNYVTTVCGSTTNAIGFTDRYFDVTVHISTTTRTNFVQIIIGNKGLESQVEAMTRVRPRQPYAFGNAVVALNPGDCSGNKDGSGFHGNPETQVFGGGVYSNGCLQTDGNASVFIEQPWTAYYGVECSKCINFSTGVTPTVSTSFRPSSSPLKVTPEEYAIDPPDCTDHWVNHLPNSPLAPGLYCINGDLNMGDTTGSDITIYVDGKLTINGNAELKIFARPSGEGSENGEIPGVLFYIPQDQAGPIKINGNSDSRFEGVIYAPGASVELTGTGDMESYKCQVIGWNVYAGGANGTGIHYDDLLNAQKPSSLDLQR